MTWDRVFVVRPADAPPPTSARATPLREPLQRVGNLGGTVAAWARVRSQVGPADRVLMLHDAGAASRSGAWAQALAGCRADLPLPGAWPTLLDAILDGLAPLADAPAELITVAWTSQLLAVRSPAACPSVGLIKHGVPLDLTSPGALELGWFRQGPRLAPGRTFATTGALREWLGPGGLADVGTFRVHRALLDELQAVMPTDTPVDLDPSLTAPALAAMAGEPRVGLAQHVAPTVAVVPLDIAGWWRLRRADEVRVALRDPAFLRAVGVRAPCVGSTAGGLPLDHLTDEALSLGVHIGGCWLRDVCLRDTHLDPGSALDDVTAVEARGQVHAAHAVLLGASGGTWRDTLVVRGVDAGG